MVNVTSDSIDLACQRPFTSEWLGVGVGALLQGDLVPLWG